jgi:damage-control phosphatase, subfamily I
MKATLDCLSCIMNQALRAARIATSDEAVQRRILEDVARQMPDMDLQLSPAQVSLAAYQATSRHSGKLDPYWALKRKQNALALGMEPNLRQILAASDQPLVTALHLAAAGNVIDLGTLPEEQIDIHGAVAQVLDERFSIDHTSDFLEALAACDDLLYLLDNAGEIVFDKLLIEQLAKHTRVTAVVKGAPILNDVVLEDAHEVGLTEVCDIIDNGGPFIGCPLELVPDTFLARMRQADIILGKGQGNYETVDDFDGNVFLILRAKCEVVARHMGVNYGQVGLISTRRREQKQVPVAAQNPHSEFRVST